MVERAKHETAALREYFRFDDEREFFMLYMRHQMFQRLDNRISDLLDAVNSLNQTLSYAARSSK